MMFRSAVFIMLSIFIFCAHSFAQEYSHGPRQKGEVILDELLMGKNSFFATVGSGGCTSKGSFRLDVRKEEGVTPQAPHYVLTINRVALDECKAIVEGGTLLSWDLEKDLGLKGPFTFSVRNKVYSGFHPFASDDDDSLVAMVRKHISARDAQSKGTEAK
jgi:hypothetical protein